MRFALIAASAALAGALAFGSMDARAETRGTGTYCEITIELYVASQRRCETVNGYGVVVRSWSFWWTAIGHF